MMFVQRMAWAMLVVCWIATPALAGPNAGGVLVVHSTSLAYTADQSTYIGQSGVACGQDGPQLPNVPVCPPYDPEGACNVAAANPTSTQPVGVAQIWFVLAAFPPESCPRLKAAAFQIMYDEARVGILASGIDDQSAFDVKENSVIDSRPWPAPGSQVGWSFGLPLPLGPSTSHLHEMYWFAGYAYAGPGDAFFELLPHGNPLNRSWIDDSTPPVEDPIMGYGKLGLAGSTGVNPTPIQAFACCVGDVCKVLTPDQCTAQGGVNTGEYYCSPQLCPINPIEESTWGQVKHRYSK